MVSLELLLLLELDRKLGVVVLGGVELPRISKSDSFDFNFDPSPNRSSSINSPSSSNVLLLPLDFILGELPVEDFGFGNGTTLGEDFVVERTGGEYYEHSISIMHLE